MAEPQQVPAAVVPVVTVNMLDIYTKQVEMGTQLAVISEQLRDLPDHEARIRILETTRARLYGACALLAAVAGSAAGWLTLLTAHR